MNFITIYYELKIIIMREFLLAIFLFFSLTIFSQSNFQKTYFGINSIVSNSMTIVGNDVLILGKDQSFPSKIVLININMNGQVQSNRNYSFNSNLDNGYIVSSGTNRYLFGSNNAGSLLSNIFMAKIQATGQIIWSKEIVHTDSIGFKQAVAINNSAIIVGGNILTNTKQNIFIAKTDSSGNILWSKSIGTTNNNEELHSIEPTSDGGFLVSGTSDLNDINGDIFVMKIDSSGQHLWNRTFDFVINSFSNNIANHGVESSNGQIYVCGTSKTYQVSPNDEVWTPFVLKLSSNGSFIYLKSYEINSGNNGATKIKERNSNEFVFAGYTGPYTLLTSISGSGNSNWSYLYTNGFITKSYGIDVNVVSNGYLMSSTRIGVQDSLSLIRTAFSGNSGCFEQIPSSQAFANSRTPTIDSLLLNTLNITTSNIPVVITDSTITIDTDIQCESLTTVKENIESSEVVLYPNPASEYITISMPITHDQVKGEFILINSIGKVILNQAIDGFYLKIELKNIPKGMYFYRLINNGSIFSGKVVIQ